MEEIYKKYLLLNNQNVPRETLLDFEIFIEMIISRNNDINLSKSKHVSRETLRCLIDEYLVKIWSIKLFA